MTPASFAAELAQGLELISEFPEFAELRGLPEAHVLMPALRAALEKLDDGDKAFRLDLGGLVLHVAASTP